MCFFFHPAVGRFQRFLFIIEIQIAYLRAEFLRNTVRVFGLKRQSVVRPQGIRYLKAVIKIFVPINTLTEIIFTTYLFHIALGEIGIAVRAEIRFKLLFGAAARSRLQQSQSHIERQRAEHTVFMLRAYFIKKKYRIFHVAACHILRFRFFGFVNNRFAAFGFYRSYFGFLRRAHRAAFNRS